MGEDFLVVKFDDNVREVLRLCQWKRFSQQYYLNCTFIIKEVAVSVRELDDSLPKQKMHD